MSLIDRLINDLSEDQLTLDQIKMWLKIEHDMDNEILINLRDVSVYEAYNFMQNDFEEEIEGELVEKPIPFNIKLACLMFIAYLYENRGNELTQLPLNCMRLITPYKKLVGL